MVTIEEFIIPFAVPAITALVIFISQWYKKSSVIEVSHIDVQQMKEKLDNFEIKLEKIIEKMNALYTDTEIFRYRMKAIERMLDDAQATTDKWEEFKTSYRPKDSHGE